MVRALTVLNSDRVHTLSPTGGSPSFEALKCDPDDDVSDDDTGIHDIQG